MEELIDVLNEDGTKTGKVVTRKEVHEKGLWHRIVVIAIIDKEGHILMQQRAKAKETNPEKWDVSVAGHVSAGQTSIEAAIREVKEEIGIDLEEKDLQYMLTYQKGRKVKEHFYANHIFDFYLVKTEVIDASKIKIQQSEVEQVKLCNLEEVQNMLSNSLVVERKPVYEVLIKYLK